MNQTKVMACDCKNEQSGKFQNKLYGEGNRIHIRSEKNKCFTCTICGKTKNITK